MISARTHKIAAVLFERDRERIVFWHALQHLHTGHVQFKTARRALVCAHLAFNDDAGFLREPLYRFKDFGWNGIFRDHALNGSTAIAENREEQFPAFAKVIEPAADRDRLAFVFANFCDGGDWVHAGTVIYRRLRRGGCPHPPTPDEGVRGYVNFYDAICNLTSWRFMPRPGSRRSLPSSRPY